MRTRSARLLDAAFASVIPSLSAVVLMQHVAVPLLPPMSGLPRWLAGACVVLWLLGTLALARVASGRTRWTSSLWLGAAAALVAAAVAATRAYALVAAAGWLVVAVSLALLAVVVGRCQHRPARRRPQGVAAAAEAAMAAPTRGPAAWPLFVACTLVFVDGFLRSLGPPADGQRGAGMLLMLAAFFLLLPAASIATWYPRAATLTWWVGALAALCVSGTVAAASAPGVASALIACAAGGFGAFAFLRTPRKRGAARPGAPETG